MVRSDSRRCEAADEGDATKTHPPEEGGTGRLHDEVLQENPQLREQSAAVWISSGRVAKGEEAVVNERQQQASLTTEQHKNSCWHQEDLVAGNELEDVLLVGCQLVQEVSDEHHAARAHLIQNFLCVSRCMKQRKEENWEDAHGDGVRVDENQRVKKVMAAVLLERLGQEGPAQLEAWQPLVKAEGTGEGVGQQGSLVEVSSCIGSQNRKNKHHRAVDSEES